MSKETIAIAIVFIIALIAIFVGHRINKLYNEIYFLKSDNRLLEQKNIQLLGMIRDMRNKNVIPFRRK